MHAGGSVFVHAGAGRKSRSFLRILSPRIPISLGSERSAAWESARFGYGRPLVRIQPLRLWRMLRELHGTRCRASGSAGIDSCLAVHAASGASETRRVSFLRPLSPRNSRPGFWGEGPVGGSGSSSPGECRRNYISRGSRVRIPPPSKA